MFFRNKKEEKVIEEEIPKLKPKKIEKEDDGLEWDKKRILTTLLFGIIAIFLVMELKHRFFPDTNILGESTVKKASEIEKPSVKGPNMDLESKVGSTLNEVKNNINQIDPEEVATSSPQIQKVLNDIQGIRDLPADKARNTCMKICSGI